MRKLLVLICFLFTVSSVVKAQNKNIIFILVDDQGWNGTSVQMDLNYPGSKSDYYQTPNLESLASNGMTFSHAYASAPKCSPSRNSILTGQTAAASFFTNTTSEVNSGKKLTEPSSYREIDPRLTTFPEVIKAYNSNYLTGHFGKWHLGSQGPENHGFDRSDGNTSNLDPQGTMEQSDPKLIYSITDSAIAFMQDAIQTNRPFYLQLSHYAVHEPTEATASSLATYANTGLRPVGTVHTDGDFGAMTEDLDASLSAILDSLTSWNIDNNTYVVYMSDNGAQVNKSPNTPLQSGKIFLWEGGLRVPLIIKGPNIPANSRSSVPVIGYDLYPTFIEWITGSTTDVPSNVEGGSFASVALSGTGSVSRTNNLIFHSPHYEATTSTKKPRSAIIQDSMKMIVNYNTGNFKLYNLNSDIEETTNVKSTYTTIFNNLLLELRDYLRYVGAQMPILNPSHVSNSGSSPDSDEDDLDDDWEVVQMLTTNYIDTDDPDLDGFDNESEFNAGMDPYVWDASIATSTGCATIYNIIPNSGNMGETGVDIHIVLNDVPNDEIPLLITIDDVIVSDISMESNVISAVLSIPLDVSTGAKDVTVEFPSGSCVATGIFDVGASSYTSSNRVYVDASASGGPPYNGTSWANAYKKLHTAINITSNNGGGEIWVAKGQYTPNSSDRANSIKLKSGVYVYGGFDGTETVRSQRDYVNNSTILSGDIGIANDASDNSYHVVMGKTGAILDGFFITDGNADGEFSDRLGGGMVNEDEGPLISNCVFYNNYAEEGGAVYNIQEDAIPIFSDCTFKDNDANKGGGMVCRSGAHAYIKNCLFENNSGEWRGGAIFIDYGADPIIDASIITNNDCADGNGAGIYVDDNASQLDGTDPIIINTTISNNTASHRGGAFSVFSGAASPVLYNCTFSNNSAGAGGGAIAVDNQAVIYIKNGMYSGNSGGTGSNDIDNSNGTVNIY